MGRVRVVISPCMVVVTAQAASPTCRPGGAPPLLWLIKVPHGLPSTSRPAPAPGTAPLAWTPTDQGMTTIEMLTKLRASVQ